MVCAAPPTDSFLGGNRATAQCRVAPRAARSLRKRLRLALRQGAQPSSGLILGNGFASYLESFPALLITALLLLVSLFALQKGFGGGFHQVVRRTVAQTRQHLQALLGARIQLDAFGGRSSHKPRVTLLTTRCNKCWHEVPHEGEEADAWSCSGLSLHPATRYGNSRNGAISSSDKGLRAPWRTESTWTSPLSSMMRNTMR